MTTVDMDSLILPAFRGVVREVLHHKASELVCKGGRNSTKSCVLAYLSIIYILTEHQSVAALVLYNNRVTSRLVNNFKFCLRQMGEDIENLFIERKSPPELILKNSDGTPSNCSIAFYGAENPEILKSAKSRSGTGYGLVWFEELTSFRSFKDIESLRLTLLRGIKNGITLYSYNPPRSNGDGAWVNKEFNCSQEDETVEYFDSHTLKSTFKYKVPGEEQARTSVRLIHHSSYLDVIEGGHEDWLGDSFLASAEQTKQFNETIYKNVYLGMGTDSEGDVFHNIHEWTYNQDDIKGCELYRGLDHTNGGKDPEAYICVAYNRKTRDLYIIDEYYKSGVSIDDIVAALKSRVKTFDIIYGDSAQPLLNKELNSRSKGHLNVVNCKKTAGSVKTGILFLQSCNIFIDKIRCQNCFREFTNYSYVINKDDEVTSELQDKDNHLIDACRYALQDVIRFGV